MKEKWCSMTVFGPEQEMTSATMEAYVFACQISIHLQQHVVPFLDGGACAPTI